MSDLDIKSDSLSLLTIEGQNSKDNSADGRSFEALYQSFRWDIPEALNIAQLVCTRHADGTNRLALTAEDASGGRTQYSFDQLELLSNQLATVFSNLGVMRGDRVAVVLPQRVETALVHLAAHKLGAVSLPLSVLFGDDALRYRLSDSQSKLVITNAARLDLIKRLSSELPELTNTLCVDSLPDASGAADFWALLNGAVPVKDTAVTSKDDPAFLLYTSGTTGPPKGALIPHRALIGNLTGFELSQNGFPKENDCMYTPADWAWTGGLLDGLLPSWYYGVPVLGYDSQKFEAERIAEVMSRNKVTCTFMPPTALKMLRAVPDIFTRYPSSLRSVMSAGEAVGEELLLWGRKVLDLDINEMCGQTEHNYLMGNCSAIMPVKPGSMGKAYPGHRVALMNSAGQLLDQGEQGEIVAHRDDPVHFLGYWNNPEATNKKYTRDWFHTGDVGYIDGDGYLWFMGRADDVISSAGYRIGPGEIEDCALQHPAVLQAAAIGVPDPDGIRGDVVKLCIVLNANFSPTTETEKQLQQHVRTRLAAYEYPRIIEFYKQLPMTTTGKVKRKELRDSHNSLSIQ